MAMQTGREAVTTNEPTSTNHAALAMVTTLFFMWGLLTSLNDILVPHLKLIFDLNYAEVMLIQFCFFSAYFVFAIPSGKADREVRIQSFDGRGSVHDGRRSVPFYPGS